MHCLLRWLSVAIALGLLVGCGGPDFEPPQEAPAQWQKAMREEAPGGWVVWGYGTAPGEASLAGGRSRADSRARSHLAERVDSRLKYVGERLIERLSGKGDKDLEKTDIRAVIQRAGEIAVNSALVRRRERDDEGAWHALARTRLRPALEEAVRNRGLPKGAGQRLMAEADRILRAESPNGQGAQ